MGGSSAVLGVFLFCVEMRVGVRGDACPGARWGESEPWRCVSTGDRQRSLTLGCGAETALR